MGEKAEVNAVFILDGCIQEHCPQTTRREFATLKKFSYDYYKR